MSNLISGFDATQVEPQDSFEPIPAGWYEVMIVESVEKENRALTGSYLQLRLDVIGGEYENRVLFERLNLNNPNQTAVEIAQRTLAAICHAVGVLQPNDASDLYNIPLMAKVAIQPPRGEYEASNVIKGYKALAGTATAPSSAPKSAAPAPAAKKPWE